MPRVRRKQLGRKRDLLCDAMLRSLETGTFCASEWGWTEPTIEEKREAWEELRDELMKAWIAEDPCTRPWAWWAFDAPERRRRINGLHPFDSPERRRHGKRFGFKRPNDLYMGMPASLMVEDDADAEYESEPDYLDRLGELTDSERDTLPRVRARLKREREEDDAYIREFLELHPMPVKKARKHRNRC